MPAYTLPVALNILADTRLAPVILPPDPPALIIVLAYTLPLALTNPAVKMLPAVILPVTDSEPKILKLPAFKFPVALMLPLVKILPPVMLPLEIIVPDTLIPVGVITTTLPTVLTERVILALALAILTLLFPLRIVEPALVEMPVNNAPLPMKKLPLPA